MKHSQTNTGNKFHLYKDLHDKVYNYLLEAISKEDIAYWVYQYDKLWINCWKTSTSTYE